jgi:hypothetical protein
MKQELEMEAHNSEWGVSAYKENGSQSPNGRNIERVILNHSLYFFSILVFSSILACVDLQKLGFQILKFLDKWMIYIYTMRKITL